MLEDELDESEELDEDDIPPPPPPPPKPSFCPSVRRKQTSPHMSRYSMLTQAFIHGIDSYITEKDSGPVKSMRKVRGLVKFNKMLQMLF